MPTSELSARIRFLNESAHLLFSQAPETSRYLMSKRNKLALDNNINLAETKLSHTCNACGTLMIIGWHGAISIESRIPRKQKKQRRKVITKKQQPGVLIYECNTCHRKTRQNLSSQSTNIKERKSLKFSALQTRNCHNNSQPKTDTTNTLVPSSNTQKRRRTKKNTLETLIEQKQKSQSASYGFDLMDFLKKA